jgi:hypothetical protein
MVFHVIFVVCVIAVLLAQVSKDTNGKEAQSSFSKIKKLLAKVPLLEPGIEQDGSSGNTADLYLGGAVFESRVEYLS